jgi:hypothetical protein
MTDFFETIVVRDEGAVPLHRDQRTADESPLAGTVRGLVSLMQAAADDAVKVLVSTSGDPDWFTFLAPIRDVPPVRRPSPPSESRAFGAAG